MSEELFNHGWRDPGDDSHRMVYYVSWTLGFIGSIFLGAYSISMLTRHQAVTIDTMPGDSASFPVLPWFLLALSVLTMLRTGLKLFPEIKRARKQKLTAEAFIAGGFLAGAALILLGLERSLWANGNPARVAILVIAGAIVLAGTLAAGILFAFLPKLAAIPKTHEGAIVESRYAIDKRLMEIYDHPNPVDEGCVPMVLLRTKDGKVLTLRAGAVPYELASPGATGTARVAGTRLTAFRPLRRP